ncbi:MAG: hypothetical protein AB1505_29675, partial [Candidatus Latescibacterota bacterium]
MPATDLRQLLGAASAEVEHQISRMEAELGFAEALCDLHPERAEGWSRLVAQARGLVAEELVAGRLDGVVGAVRRAEEQLAPMAETAKGYAVHCVGHAHI